MDDNTRIVRSVDIHAPRARVWRAVSKVSEFGEWFSVKTDGEFIPGKRVGMVSTYPGHEGVRWFVEVVSLEPEWSLSWRWFPGAPEEGVDPEKGAATLVTFTLEDIEGGTRVTVVESGFDQVSAARRARVYGENTEGWKIQMASLERYAGKS